MNLEMAAERKNLEHDSSSLIRKDPMRGCDKCSKDEAVLHRAAVKSAHEVMPPIVHEVLHTSGQPLEPATRSFMEPQFGYDFSQVRVHTGARSAESAEALGALAYTYGHDIVFGAEQYMPGTIKTQRLLAHELTHVIQQTGSFPSIQRQPKVVELPPQVILSDKAEENRRAQVDTYSNICLLYFSDQSSSGLKSFELWYKGQPRADVSFYNSVINVVMNSAWAWGSKAVGGVVAPVGSVIMLVAQEAANQIQADRDKFADSLSNSANNLQSGIQRRLMGNVSNKIMTEDPVLWNGILGEMEKEGGDWHSLLHSKAGIPRMGENYQVRLLSQLIFEYKRWELSTHSRAFQGIYSMNDPYLAHMSGRSEAEAYLQAGEKIPERLKIYARPGEAVESR